jgi:hypothetical protein
MFQQNFSRKQIGGHSSKMDVAAYHPCFVALGEISVVLDRREVCVGWGNNSGVFTSTEDYFKEGSDDDHDGFIGQRGI